MFGVFRAASSSALIVYWVVASTTAGSPPCCLRCASNAFFVLDPGVFDFIAGDATQFEHEPLCGLARAGELMAYRHESFWQCMDTLKEAQDLNALWQSGRAPWQIWT